MTDHARAMWTPPARASSCGSFAAGAGRRERGFRRDGRLPWRLLVAKARVSREPHRIIGSLRPERCRRRLAIDVGRDGIAWLGSAGARKRPWQAVAGPHAIRADKWSSHEQKREAIQSDRFALSTRQPPDRPLPEPRTATITRWQLRLLAAAVLALHFRAGGVRCTIAPLDAIG